jgi:hypothetical protein
VGILKGLTPNASCPQPVDAGVAECAVVGGHEQGAGFHEILRECL